MVRKPTGTNYDSNGHLYAQVTVGHNKRRSFVMLPDGIACDMAEKAAHNPTVVPLDRVEDKRLPMGKDSSRSRSKMLLTLYA